MTAPAAARLAPVSSSPLRRQLDETVEVIRRATGRVPSAALIVGSGLGALTSALQVDAQIDYAELPHMPRSTAPGHAGTLLLGTLEGQRVVVFSGRCHCYEGYTMAQVSYPVRVAQALGARTLILTSIVGSMNPKMPPGSLVLLEDHINLMGANPLIGPNDETLGCRFPDMSEPYDPALRRLALRVAAEQGVSMREGVYGAVVGPNLETRAEYRFLRQIGADVVGMSVVPEVLTARHAGLRVLAIAVVSDACIPERLTPATEEELLRVAAQTEPNLTAVLRAVLQQIDDGGHPRGGRAGRG